MFIVEILGALTLMVLIVIAVLFWHDGRAKRGLSNELRWGSHHRAATATLEAATSQLGPMAPAGITSDDGSFAERVLDPAVKAISRIMSRVSPTGYIDSVRRRLMVSGQARPLYVDRFLAGRLATIALIPAAFIAIQVCPLPKLYRLLAFLLVAVALLLGPEAQLDRRVRLRKEKILTELPRLVDLLMISVEAGQGFDQALTRAVSSSTGPLSEEFSRFLGEVRLGADRVESMEAIDARTDVPELRSFLMALVQAERFGVSIGPILKSQAQEVRIAQRIHVQELAQKAPIKMLFPLVFCVLPALFIVVIGPAAIEIYDKIIKGGVLK